MTDSDDDCRSERLESQEIDYRPTVDIPPFVQRSSPSNSDENKGAAERGTSLERSRKGLPNQKPDTVLGDQVLIDYLDQTRRDISAFERRDPLSSRVQHLPEDDSGRTTILNLKQPPKEPQSPGPSSQKDLAESALRVLDVGLKDGDKLQFPQQDSKENKHRQPMDTVKGRAAETEPTSPRLQPILPRLTIHDNRHTVDDDIHNLKQFKISSEERLPALQPTPQTAAASSPENRQNLPSIHSAIGELPGVPPKEPPGMMNSASPYAFPPASGPSPPLARNDLAREPHLLGQFPPPQIPLSPYSHLSPASSKDMSNKSSPASQQSYWRPLKSDIHYVTSSYEASPQAAKSPAVNYPTPTDQPGSERTSFSSSSQPNGATGIYKCSYPECTAPPFQTQYLLNSSHANVHSQDRPHFCPVEGCPRGVGGKGFKRKNEMIRHGLVHNSPGYVCPFCPEQQHKYPRPDNLQRHVRVHHVDKNKDDPALRAVLSQRPEGSVRGRRRRVNA
ncbi:hypothetical protein PHISCL_09912 [Aspergillus sclerotialis]|uniref:C2H2-type domain-containing protein n=1 Tax=Aspergillus sclerotialis TaxID=2070753 RepID=A0A3A2ZKR7_9EURO|nr:hypothetical protein PHISCL_09912 [Aspergillus sclerotialis]